MKKGWMTPEWGKLWCCRIVGPDDVIPAGDFDDAVRRAREVNERVGISGLARERDAVAQGDASS